MRRLLLSLVVLALGYGACAAIAGVAAAKEGLRFRPAVSGQWGVVASESHAASRVGRDVLEQGGNAIDAAVATVFAMGVARPQSCGIGGGGFMVYRSKTGAVRALDFRETAPARIKPDTFVGPGPHKTFTGHTTVGVPGTVAGMDAALARYGTISLRAAIRPAERLALDGFRVPASLTAAMAQNAQRLQQFPAARAQFLERDGTPIAAGHTLVQPILAETLRRIMREGPSAFYGGTIAKRIVRDMRAPRQTGDPGLLSVADFRAYRAKWRTPLFGSYRGRQVLAMPPPTSGGTTVLQMLNLLEEAELKTEPRSTVAPLHLMAEVQKLAFADRAAYVADPDHVDVPTGILTSKTYAKGRFTDIDPKRAQTYQPGRFARPAARAAHTSDNPRGSTTHISVIDQDGAAVALTCTIEQEFGSAVVAPGTGFLLNNELTDFGPPGTANEPRPGKRPRSSMAPTIVVDRRQPILVTGGAGGARIIMGVLQAIVNTVDYRLDPAHAIDAERIEAGGPALLLEHARLDPQVISGLEELGHRITREGEYAVRPRVQAASRDALRGRTFAVSDPRTTQASLAQRRAAP